MWATLMIGYPPLLVLGALPFILNNRVFLVPFMILLPVVEGGYILSFPVPTETLTLLFIGPLLVFDILMSNKARTLAELDISRFFIAYIVLVSFGAFVAVYSAQTDVRNVTILINSSIIIGQLIFFYLLYMAFVQMGIPKLREGLLIMQYIAVPLFVGFFIYMNVRGISYGFNQYLNFGFTSHGTFSASIVGLSAYLLYRFAAKGKSITHRFWVIPPIIMMVWIIFKSDSRNGLLSLLVMIFLAVIILRGSTIGARRGLIVGFVSLAFLVAISGNWNRPEFVRLRDRLSEENSINEISTGRTKLWYAGLKGFAERPLTGQGGDNLISRQYAEKAVGINNVIHNTPMEMAIQYGLIGIILYFFLQIKVIRGYWNVSKFIKRNPLEIDGVFLLPFLTYFSLLFSALFVSWLWRSLVWYHVGLIFAIITLHRRSLKEPTD